MVPRALLALAPIALLLAACASPGQGAAHWAKAGGGTASDFATDNHSCGAAATRVKPTPRPDQLPGGATAPDNRIDQPPRAWTSAVAEGAYMDCMAQRGWRVVRR